MRARFRQSVLLACCATLGAWPLALPGQQPVRPPVRDQNTSGAPQRAQKAEAPDSSGLVEQGMAALEQGNAAAAERTLSEAVALDAENIGARFYLALALAMQGKDAAALPHYAKLVEAQPDVYEIRVNYGQSLLSLERYADAAEQLERADGLKPNQPKTVYMLGYAELAAGDAEGARPRFEAVLAQDPTHVEARYGLAQSALRMNDLVAAETAFREASKDPRYRESLLQLARHYEQQGDAERAAALYQEFPQNPEAQARAGELLIRAGKAKEAIAALEEAVKDQPTFANRQALAVAYLRAGDRPKAAAQFATAVEADPQNREARISLGRVLRDQRKFREAAQQFGAALKLDAQDAATWSEFAGVAVLAEEYQAAFDAIAQIEKLGAMKPGHYYLRAIVLDRFQQADLAIAQYEQFLAQSQGQNEDEEFKARQRLRILKNKKKR